MRNQKGFTLIKVMFIVSIVSIVSILAAALITKIQSNTKGEKYQQSGPILEIREESCISYMYDSRTEMCFALYKRYSSDSFAMVLVPCEKVKPLLGR